MGIFKEKGVDVIDYTLLKKKGLLKDEEEESKASNLSNNASSGVGGFFDSIGNKSQANAPFDFLDNSSSIQNHNYPETSLSQQTTLSDLNSLKIKIEDVEYKIERLLERLAKIEENLGK